MGGRVSKKRSSPSGQSSPRPYKGGGLVFCSISSVRNQSGAGVTTYDPALGDGMYTPPRSTLGNELQENLNR